MATLETRDFLGMIDHHYLHYSSSSSSLHFSLRAMESDRSNNAEMFCEEEATTTNPAKNDSSPTHKRKRNELNYTLLDGRNVYGYRNISPLDLLMPAPLRNSHTPPRIPLKRKASLARFFQMRHERVQNLRLNGRNSSSDRSVTLLQLRSEKKSESITAHTELELYGPSSVKMQGLQSLEAQ